MFAGVGSNGKAVDGCNANVGSACGSAGTSCLLGASPVTGNAEGFANAAAVFEFPGPLRGAQDSGVQQLRTDGSGVGFTLEGGLVPGQAGIEFAIADDAIAHVDSVIIYGSK